MGRLRLHPHLAAFAGYAALASLLTRPLVPRFFEAIAGDAGDPFQTLWGFWWFHRALAEGRSPFFCDLLHWPQGAPLAFQSWDLPSTLATLPLWSAVPPLPAVSLYNAAAFLSFPLAGLAMYLLIRELWGGYTGAFVAGAIHTFGSWHFAHAIGHLHLESMQWNPLFFLGLVRAVRGQGPHAMRGAILGGAALALAAGASFYHLLACTVGGGALLAAWAWQDRRTVLSARVARRLATLGGLFLLLAGWLYVLMLRAKGTEPYAGAHASDYYSADLQSFFMPNEVSIWSGWIRTYRRWTGNAAENAAYLGYVPLALGAWAGVRSRAVRPWLAAAALGVVLSLGPYLHVHGHVVRAVLLPYGWMERLAPTLAFAGCPTRLSWLATFGLVVAAGWSLQRIADRGPRGVAAACGLGLLALIEVAPRPQIMAAFPAPAFLRALAADPQRWAVLDASQRERALWNGTLHGHPQLGGYVTRSPLRLDRALDTPALRPFLGPFEDLERTPVYRDETLRTLRRLRVRYVIADEERIEKVRELRLPIAWEGEGTWVFRVEGTDGPDGEIRPDAPRGT